MASKQRRRRAFPRPPLPSTLAPHQPEARVPRYDLSDPKVRDHIAKALRKLERRILERLEVLHYFQASDGTWNCLDLSLHAESTTELDEAVIEYLRAPRLPEFLCPAAPEEMWMRMVRSLTVRYRMLVCPGSLRTRHLVAECSEVSGDSQHRK